MNKILDKQQFKYKLDDVDDVAGIKT